MTIRKTIGNGPNVKILTTDLEVGAKVTIMYWSDSEPATVVKMSKGGNKIVVRHNKAIHVGNPYENIWDITDELVGEEKIFYRHRNGEWYSRHRSSHLDIFHHLKYYDFSF